MNELTLRSLERWDGEKVDFYENKSHEVFMTAEQIGRALRCSNPRRDISELILQVPYLKEEGFSSIVRLRNTDGKVYRNRVFSLDGIYEIALLSGAIESLKFRTNIRTLLKGFRNGSIEFFTKI